MKNLIPWSQKPLCFDTVVSVRGEVKLNPESVFYELTVRLRGKVM